MSRNYPVQMPRAEARNLAAIPAAWPATPEARAVAALREWLHGITRRRAATVPITKIATDLTAILSLVPSTPAPARGPFGPGRPGLPLPGRADYLGSGLVRLDDTALSALATLPAGEDFRVSFTESPGSW